MILIEKSKKSYLTKKKNIFLFIGIIIGLVMVIIGSGNINTKQAKEDYSKYLEDYTTETEKRISELINRIDGVSDAKVMITLSCGNEFVYARDGGESDMRHVVVNDELIYTKEYLPKIEGVAVVCRGGNDPIKQATITELICSLFGLYSTHVCVTE